MRIAVLGGGNGAFAAAVDLTEKGHEVRHWRRDARALREVIRIEEAAGAREVRIARACAEVGEAVRGAERRGSRRISTRRRWCSSRPARSAPA